MTLHFLTEERKYAILFAATLLCKRINQRREVETHDIDLQLGFIAVLNHGANDGILDLAVVQVHADFLARAELSVVWLLWGWRRKEMYQKL